MNQSGRYLFLFLLLSSLLAGCATISMPPGSLQAHAGNSTLTPSSETLISNATQTPSATPRPTVTATKPPETTTPTPTLTPSPTTTPTVTFTPTATPVPYADCMLDSQCTPVPATPVERLQTTDNILLLGTDRREGWDNWRTDTIMLVIIDWNSNQAAIVSFPRDTYLYHPQFGKRRINSFDYLGEAHKYQGGGFQVMKELFDYNFGVPVQHVIRIHRSAFVETIDALGGIDVTLDCDLWELSPKDGGGYKVLYLPAGMHHLDGEEALKFATYRYRTNDWGRARRQQAVLAAVKKESAQLGLLTKAPQLWEIVTNNVSTDLSFTDVLHYAKFGINTDMRSIHSHVLSDRELEAVTLPSSAYILLQKEGAIHDVLENIFLYVSISVQDTHPNGCPPPPDWAASYLQQNSMTPQP